MGGVPGWLGCAGGEVVGVPAPLGLYRGLRLASWGLLVVRSWRVLPPVAEGGVPGLVR